MPQAKAQDIPSDVLIARLIQARAALLAVQNTWDAEHGFSLSGECLYEALWAVDELLTQAKTAWDEMSDDRIAAIAETRVVQ